MLDRYTGWSKLVLSCVALLSLSNPALAQRNDGYPLDVELLGDTSTPTVTNLRQNQTHQHVIVNIGASNAHSEPQPEMICPTAKSPTIQEWSTQPLPKVAGPTIVGHTMANHSVVIHHATAPVKPQVVAHQTAEPVSHGTPVSIASAYPFNTGSRSYAIAGKSSSHHSTLR